jgi:DNA polymerase zeta
MTFCADQLSIDGYTAAGFSGRMPMAELADAIVQSGRTLLEWTIGEINRNPSWRAEVVYGDTDSVFILVPGRTLRQAFLLGQEIARHITGRSPTHVVLKFEKVYFPSILVTKKRYSGYSFESIDQVVPHFEAKGIEVARRDQCPATVKMQEKALRILFDTKDISQVRSFLMAEWNKMMTGMNSFIHSFIHSWVYNTRIED